MIAYMASILLIFAGIVVVLALAGVMARWIVGEVRRTQQEMGLFYMQAVENASKQANKNVEENAKVMAQVLLGGNRDGQVRNMGVVEAEEPPEREEDKPWYLRTDIQWGNDPTDGQDDWDDATSPADRVAQIRPGEGIVPGEGEETRPVMSPFAPDLRPDLSGEDYDG